MKNRANVASALLSNTKDLEEAYKTAMDAEGSALRENEKYLDSIQGKLDQFNNAVQTMWNNALNSDVVKGVVDLGTGLIKIVDKIGLLPSILSGVFIYFTAFKKSNPLDWIKDVTQYLSAFRGKDGIKQLIGQLLGIAPAMKVVTAETVANTLATQTNDAVKTKAIMTSMGLTGATGTLSVAQKKQAADAIVAAINTNQLSMAQGQAALATLGFSTAVNVADGSIKAVNATTKSFMATNPVGWILLVVSAIVGVVMWISTWDSKTEKLTKKLKEAREEYDKSKETLEGLNSELETTKKRIEELQKLGTLTVTEKEELKELKKYNLELEKRVRLAEKINVAAERETAEKAVETFQDMPKHDRTLDSENAYDIYKQRVFGQIPNVGSANWDGILERLYYDDDQNITNLNAIYDAITERREQYLKAINDKDELIKIMGHDPSSLSDDEKEYLLRNITDKDIQTSIDQLADVLETIESEAFKKISNETTGYQTLLNDMSPRYEHLMSVDSKLWTESDQELVNTYKEIEKIIQGIWQKYDPSGWFDLSKGDIWADDQFEGMYDSLYKFAQDGHLDENELRDNFNEDIVNALVAAAEDKGILLADLLNDIVSDAERDGVSSEGTSIADSLNKISSLEEAYNSLGSAIQEFKEDGTASASTLEGLKETFGKTKGFEELYKVLATGEGNVEEAITNVANAYIGQAEILSDLTEDERQIMIARLEALGAINAEEVVMSRQVAQEKLDTSYEQYGIDLGNYATAEEAKLMIAQQLGLDVNTIEGNTITELENKYGMDLSNYASVAEAKIKIAQEVAKKTAELNKNTAINTLKTQYKDKYGEENTYDLGYFKEVDRINEEYKNTISSIDETGSKIASIQSIVNDYYSTPFQFDFSADKIGIGRDFDTEINKDGDDKRLENLQKKYERQIKNLEGQQTYIENEIERLEAEEQGVSADYYEKQIELENQKIDLYEQEREELLKLERTDEVADALWEVEHAIQESTLRTIEFRKSIAELYATASQGISDAYGDKKQLFDDRKSYIENEISIRETKGELAPTSAYDELIEQEKQNRADAEAELNAQAELYWQGINNGDFTADSEQAIGILETIRQKKLEIQESDKTIAGYAEQQKDAYIAYYDKMMEAYGHRNDLLQSQSDYAQSYIDRLETLNINVPDEAYDKLAEIQELTNEGLKEQLAFASGELEEFESQGIDKNDPRYIEKFKEVLDLEKQVYEGETKVLEYHQQIIDNHLDRFNQVVDRINHSISQLENISGLISDEDVANEDGSWTAEGLTQLGMAYQQMEYNKQTAADYAEEMKYLKEQLDSGQISEKEYTEKLQELQNGQWDAINAYKSAEDAIVDLNEARIDMIEEGLNKEVEAYQELIDLKKEELQAERDLFDFKKDVEKQTKDIAALERRIASMSGSTDASTIAEKTKLEAELRELQGGLNDTFYNHAMDSQQNALDDELEAFTKSSEDYIQSLRESIKDTDLLIEKTFTDVMQNGDIVLSTLTELSNTYGFQLDEYLTAPWKNATTQSLDFNTYATQHFNAVYEAVETKTSDLTERIKAPWTEGETQASVFNQKSKEYMEGVVNHAEYNYKTQLKDRLNYPWEQANGYESWGDGIKGVLDQAVLDAEIAGKKIAESLNVDVEPPSYEGNGGGDTGSGDTGGKVGNSGGGGGTKTGEDVKALQTVLNGVFGTGLTLDGSYGPATKAAVKKVQERLGLSADGYYGTKTRNAIIKYLNDKIFAWQDASSSSMVGQGVRQYEAYKQQLPAAMYAKGTMGTKSSGFAITDESWIGEEITLAAGKNGQLQYLKKGSAVMPADISANLVEWGKLNPNMMNIGDMSSDINLISNCVSKPEVNVAFDSLVHVDNCSQETLKDLEKMVDTKINQFSKNLNYSLRRIGAT